MPLLRNLIDIDFDGPALYRITVKGRIEDEFYEYLSSMQIITESQGDQPILTIITGEVKDQAELIGILSGIYELHLPIIAVENLAGKKATQGRFDHLINRRKI